MSSCEPTYSWNILHSHQLGARDDFLTGMYSLFAGAVSRQTYTSCEHRGGVSGITVTAAFAVYLARLAVVDDELADNELHLLRLTPLAWVMTGFQDIVIRGQGLDAVWLPALVLLAYAVVFFVLGVWRFRIE
ncbi:MAG: hypothetical protein ACK2UH_16505, partial [Candidatus Promineifilaceae bacterium]